MKVVVVDSGVANLASIAAAFERLGAPCLLASRPRELEGATHLVVPGVGSFERGIGRLRETGLDAAARRWFESGKPLLAVCLGMQLLAEGSEESPGVPGLGLVPGVFERLPDSVRVPHLGWNTVRAAPGGVLANGQNDGEAAFANSYALTSPPEGWRTAWTHHGVRFVAALERGRRLLCQFHPELSGEYGAALLGRWLDGRRRPDAASSSPPAGRLTRRIVPCLDVRDGRIVKGVRFANLRDAGDPAEQARAYEAQGADEIVVLDVAASPRARRASRETVERVRAALGIPLTVGGGVTRPTDAGRLLAAGADKVSVNTAAVRDPHLLTRLAAAYGSQCVVLAIDARRNGSGWEALVMGGREPGHADAVEWARRGAELGAGEILLTSWDRDGTRAGCDLELIAAVRDAVATPIVASGGIGSREQVAAAFAAGADAVLAASIFHDGDETVAGIKSDLAARGVEVRR